MQPSRIRWFLYTALLSLGTGACTMGDIGALEGDNDAAAISTAPAVRAEVMSRFSGEAFREVVDAADLPDGSLLLVLKSGRLMRFNPADGSTAVVADLKPSVYSSPERGALAVVLHPTFGSDGENRIFFSYIAEGSGVTRLESLRIDPIRMTAISGGTTILEFAHFNGNHNAADLEFDAAGQLLMATGDSGGSGDPEKSSQDPGSRLGKLLEIDVEALPPAVKVRALGLRNPWKITLDKESQQLWIADVGQDQLEEVSVLSLADVKHPVNFGWPIMEGDRCYGTDKCTPPSDHVSPYATYAHNNGRCSIIGAALVGERFLFGDYCTGEIMAIPTTGLSGREPAVLSWRGDPPSVRPGGIYADRTGRIWIFDQASPSIVQISVD